MLPLRKSAMRHGLKLSMWYCAISLEAFIEFAIPLSMTLFVARFSNADQPMYIDNTKTHISVIRVQKVREHMPIDSSSSLSV